MLTFSAIQWEIFALLLLVNIKLLVYLSVQSDENKAVLHLMDVHDALLRIQFLKEKEADNKALYEKAWLRVQHHCDVLRDALPTDNYLQ